MKHTPTPWKIIESFNRMPDGSISKNLFMILDSSNNKVLDYISRGDLGTFEFIVHAVNSHNELLEAAKEALDTFQSLERNGIYICHAKQLIEKAIANAERK